MPATTGSSTTSLKSRTMNYRRVMWPPDYADPRTLMDYLNDAKNQLTTVASRSFTLGTMKVECRSWAYDAAKERFRLHIATYTPGEEMSTVPQADLAAEAGLDSTEAPDGAEFLDGDYMMMVHHDHVITMSSGMSDGRAHFYLQELLKATGHSSPTTGFELVPIVNVDRLQMVRQEGVKRIELGGAMYDAAVDHAERHGPGEQGAARRVTNTMIRSVREAVNTLIREDAEYEELRRLQEEDNLNVKISLNVKGRGVHREHGVQQLTRLAEEIDEDEDTFKIVTNSGTRVSHAKIVINKPIRIPGDAKTVSLPKVWEEMDQYFTWLEGQGTLEQ